MHAEHEKTLAALLLALGVICALFFPQVSHFFAPYLLQALFFVMVFSLLPFARQGSAELTRPRPVVLALVFWQQGVLPAITLGVGLWFDMDREWLFFLLVTVTSGSLFASPTLVQLMGLEQKMAVQTVVWSTLFAPVSIYLTFSYLLGSEVHLDLELFAFRMVMFLVVPMAIFLVVKAMTKDWTTPQRDRLDGIGRWGSVIALIVFCFALEDEVTQAIDREPYIILEYLLVAVTFAVTIGLLTRFVMSRFGIRAAYTAVVLTSFRNVGLSFGLVHQFAGPELAVYVGVCQIPMFLSPLLFDLFIGRKRVPEEDNTREAAPETPAGDMWRVPTASTRPNGPGAHPNPGGQQVVTSPLNASATQTSYDYYPSGNVMVAAERIEEVDPGYSQPVPQTSEVIEYETNIVPETDAEREDARALIGRLRSQIEETQEKVLENAAALGAGRTAARHVCVLIALCFMAVVGVWEANKYFSPMLFDQKLIEKVAQTHVEGRNFAVFDLNINIRDLRNATIARMERTPELVILGASHWQEAHVNLLPGIDLYNSHVHRDYYEDMLAVTEMWVRHDKLPKEMIITIRDNLLTPIEHRTDYLWLPGIKYYRAFAERIGLEPHSNWDTLPVETWRELVSLPLLRGQAKRHLTAPVQPHATDEFAFETLDTLLPGGSILWSGEHQRLFTRERARNEALAFAKAKRNDPSRIDPKGIVHLEALFDFLKKKGVRVTLAHPQFNPIFWDAVQGSPYMDGLQKVKDQTIAWSKKYGFPIIGGFAPKDVGCSADMYIDAEHGNSTCLGMLLRQYPEKYKTSDFRGTMNGTVQ